MFCSCLLDTATPAPVEPVAAPQPVALAPKSIITYNLALFSASEQTKELKKRTSKNTFMKLSSDEPFDTWKAQLLVRIEKTFSPNMLDISNYEVNFSVARISPSPMAVSSQDKYADMLERIAKRSDLTCTIYVQELQAVTAKVNFQPHMVANG